MAKPMRTDRVYLIGAGGHCLVVLDSLDALGVSEDTIVVTDENPARVGQLLGRHVIEEFDPGRIVGCHAHICVGQNAARARLATALSEVGTKLRPIVDPRAIVSRDAMIGDGSFVAPGAIIAAGATTGRFSIINHGAIVDHECKLGDFVHIAPGATLAGAVSVGSGVLVGAGANILPGLKVSAYSTIGAGAVLIDDAADPAVYVGVPARKV